VNSFRQQMVDVPYVAGFSLRNAKNLLVKAGLGLDIKYSPDFAQNNVLEQYVGDEKVEKGSNLKIEKGSRVLLIVGLSSKATAIFAPSVVGRSLVEAKSSLWDLGINVGEVTYDAGIKAVDKNKAKVCWQSVASGQYIPYGGKVSLQLTCDNAKLEKARKGVDVKDLEEKAKADSIANLEHRRLVDSLSNIEAMKAQMEADSLAKILQDSLIIEQKTDSLPSTTPQE
jgi:beta-lactam-binding protein with PASTA domain